MELFKVALEKNGDCHVKWALAPHNSGILLRPFPSYSTKLQVVPEHRIISVAVAKVLGSCGRPSRLI
jgi:hypothetical protein